ncbi:glyoxalase [Mycolicibacterium madagascariense]|uniref:Glyoxalase n=1 Tax=Mycolicibacterium madagascariense TaxID=212765 RepID=A0A7I7XAY7_9MYCO|nr:VOC family protein [Mycolicibacterium madagascariense]MCV7011435.1 VOC family protein [Mycolicibacterium madagascariense]BBZ26816.1 glyoxalase [Mycolicibacterium madagascariense]
MTEHDPLAVLTGDDPPVRPDPAFAARLRARLESAMSRSPETEGATVTNTEIFAAPRPAALPYLTVADASAALAWYVDALGAVMVGEPTTMADGRIGHAELALAGGVLYLADEFPDIGLKGPAAQAVSVSLMLSVADTDTTLDRARDRGASVQREPYENHGARTATIIDPFGHRWMLSGPVLGSVPQIRHGDIGYVSVWTADPARSAAFYRHVLGWTYDAESRRVTNTAQPIGIVAAAGPRTLFCCYAVADAAAARQAILDAGGTAGEVTMNPHGPTVDGTDPFGTAFAVYQPVAANPRPALNGAGPGQLSYVTYQVTDSAAFREFYGRVLGWSFDPGRIDDGWEPRSVHPMAGVAGGSDEPMTVPMWTVTDIVAAVQRVREAGGTVIEEPSRQSYGGSALCADDQGVRFYLGQL